MTHVAYLGNFSSSATTESYVAEAIESHGHKVKRCQENHANLQHLPARIQAWGIDTLFWTRTPSFNCDIDEQTELVKDCERRGIRTVGLHLDRYWDLDRESDIHEHPWWRQTEVFTADGGNQERFAAAGVNHKWWRPAVPASQCGRGTYNARYDVPIAFVGSQRYHREWPWRQQLLKHLNITYRKRFRQFGRSGDRLNDDQLADAYASVAVVVGDSCLVGGTGLYWSNRIPETLGRGGFLLHPWTPGIDDHYRHNEHIVYYKAGDCRGLKTLIDGWLKEPEERLRISQAGMEHVMSNDTFEIRMGQVLATLGIRTADNEASRAPAEPCIGADPYCPCQDGDACHYKTYGDSPAMPLPA